MSSPDPFAGLNDLGLDEQVQARARQAPRAKMDSERLLGPKGLPILKKYVEKTRFKGRKHERRDLAKLLGAYQLWGHKLFPKANFDDLTALCWRAGSFSEVKHWRIQQIDNERYNLNETLETPRETPKETPKEAQETEPESILGLEDIQSLAESPEYGAPDEAELDNLEAAAMEDLGF